MLMTLKQITELLHLSEPGRRVLVVEDHVPSLQRLIDFWSEAGHDVIGMTGIDSIDGPIATGRDIGIDTFASFDVTGIDVVFMDHYFLSKTYNGATLTRELSRLSGPKILGMSSDSAANASMVRAGAVAAVRKSDLLRQMI